MIPHPKNSRLLLNIALLFVAAMLILLTVFEPGLEPDNKLPPLTSLSADSVNHIEIMYNDDVIKLERNNNQWMVTAPVNAYGNDFKIRSLLNLLRTPSHAHYTVDEIELPPVHLDKPRATIIFNDQKIEFGDTHPLNHQRYVMKDNIVHLIDDLYYHHVTATPGSYVSYRLLPPESHITAITFPDKSGMEKQDGKWVTAIAITADEITRLITDWESAEALEVKPYSGIQPKQSMNLSLQGHEKPVRFYIETGGDNYIFINESLTLQYTVAMELAKNLLEPANRVPEAPEKPAVPDA